MAKKSRTRKKSTIQRRQDRLAESVLDYELFVNELFHLKEYVSLEEYDPTYRNDSDIFNDFVKENGLELINETEEDSNAQDTGKIRRRQLRDHSIATNTSPQDKTPENASDKWLRDLSPILESKWSLLATSLSKKVNNSKKRATSVPTPDNKTKAKSLEPQYSSKESTVKLEDGFKSTPSVVAASDYDGGLDYYFTTSSEDESLERRHNRGRKRRRINLVVHPPKQTVTNPNHVISPEYASLHAYLSSFKSLDEDMSLDQYEQYLQEQRKTVSAIKKGLESGALKYDPQSDSLQPITTKEARLIQSQKPDPISFFYNEQNVQPFQDALVSQGVHYSKLFHASTRARIGRARKVSQMIEQYFKHIAGAEERKAKENERHRRTLARFAIQAVKKRWGVAERAYRVLRKDKEEELKRIQGKEHLSKMLEKSTKLLGAQLSQNKELETDGSEETSISSEDSDGEDIITSSSEDEEEEGEEHGVEGLGDRSGSVTSMDDNLTVEQLREKYMHLDEKSVPRETHEIEESSNSSLSPSVEPILAKSLELSALLDNNTYNDSDEDVSVSSVNESSEDTDMDLSSDLPSSEEDEKEQSAETENDTKDELASDPLSVEDVPIPSLLRGTLRVYQKQGLNWLASLYNNNTNGILADEMGLGKTIQTISLLAYLACEKQNWGPHLIIVPTSVLLNWEMEFKKFAPGFKVLTYYGSPQQRKEKRKGWNKLDAFHVCIVSYQLVVQDQHSFKRKKWQYMILDEAHNIKNFRSTRWQALLNFNTKRRLLLTGTPLQNNLTELWSLLYFLMPKTMIEGKNVSGFADLEAFQQWFGKPMDKIIETGEDDKETQTTVKKLHKVLRPYLLRRLKADVEKQMPAKYEHVVYCRLSKRQRFLYDDFMSRAQTKATLASGNFMSIVNCLMQLRKVCNHPDLFEVRPILSSFCIDNSVATAYVPTNQKMTRLLHKNEYKRQIGLQELGLCFTAEESALSTFHTRSINKLQCVKEFVKEIELLNGQYKKVVDGNGEALLGTVGKATKFFQDSVKRKIQDKINSVEILGKMNSIKCSKQPRYGSNLIKLILGMTRNDREYEEFNCMKELIKPLETRFISHRDMIEKYAVITPSVVTLDIRQLSLGLNDGSMMNEHSKEIARKRLYETGNPFHHLQTKLTVAFPDKSLLQYDCGKLQKLASLLQDLKDNGHRALIFTQMTKVLDILEQFLNYHGYLYMRLDGATKIEDRQALTERFNSDPRITVFILSSRSGGLGINLTGADTVIFYDSDWNPAMDKQCQDRCHRIGQTRDVHIYRFVSEHTIESNILKKANQKRQLDNVVIQKGDFTTDYLTKLSVTDLLGGDDNDSSGTMLLKDDGTQEETTTKNIEQILAQAEDEDDAKAARLAMKEVDVDNEDFTEDANKSHHQHHHDEPFLEADDEYEGTKHIEEYMLRFIANGYYYN